MLKSLSVKQNRWPRWSPIGFESQKAFENFFCVSLIFLILNCLFQVNFLWRIVD